MTAYIICTTPRSGSTLLCSLLASSGIAGQPASWFRRQDEADYAKEWGVPMWRGSWTFKDYVDAAIIAGSGSNDIFGARLMWETLPELMIRLRPSTPLHEQAAVLAETFGPLHYIHLRRHDHLAQAISRHRAEASGIWHLGIEEAENPTEASYDFNRIKTWLLEAERDNFAWTDWFIANNLAPMRVAYEVLSADPTATTLRVLSHLGLSPRNTLVAPNRRMADATSTEWAARFRAEKGPISPLERF